ncbi:SDR family NAD(P)-dependent oxidoreductase [Mycobacterium sp. E1386]|uniref:SDR family NAD(P)-dependent oxidoreductase n=1 Tax=Mycobacterium sp. E1386 TaxID=1834126 RepID=UPI0009ECE155|nr:SDR family NAD(P)-dependent oxidoreductase [Mycobacterium sp. E1386]
MTQTVVITGASAGIGRATAQLFGQRGANVALLARGSAGLDGAARDVESGGGKALSIPTDVADHAAVAAAADETEATFGPIDVWVNVAFTSVFAPFSEISAEEFKRVTEVSYLGYVHGTMAALAPVITTVCVIENLLSIQSWWIASSARVAVHSSNSACANAWGRLPRSWRCRTSYSSQNKPGGPQAARLRSNQRIAQWACPS